MKNRSYIIAIFILVLIIGCQESEITADVETDPDMEAALAEAEEFFNSYRIKKKKKDVIVIKYKKDELLYKTNTIKGKYSPVYEETVTAVTVVDGYIFWRKAGGIKKLLEIEMDEASKELLCGSEPFEIKKGKLWALWIPDDKDLKGKTLKYDIVYKTKSGDVIRLDPKIQIKQHQ